ncbi:hypothetical protein FJ444_21255 [Aestuariibacter sp. GS-14]|uniref:phosphoribosyltransferase n=1 Tax=Aestuariibacter sp. GS-14 TaxID=2590670 RepID=UPI00112D5BD9|nr:phosphoribosyltransferase family protein [Aestuariibacter sp. GS-14]TPV51732.1 hypothetical protein FJ444_21255 [Aestuariibacter sp. GS-14]
MDYLSLSIGVIGTLASILGLYFSVPSFSSWRSVRVAVQDLAKKMSIAGFKPDLVIMYGRGGAIFGGLLAGNLGNIPVISIDREVIDNNGTTETNLIHTYSLRSVQGKRVLLVTGEVATGSQLADAKRAILKKNPVELKTASYYVCETSSTYPDYYWKETKNIIHVPWRFGKSYRRTSKRALDVSV